MELDLFAGLSLMMDAHPMSPASGLTRSVFVPPDTLPAAAGRLLESDYHLEDISGLDCTEGILVNYHFNRYDRSDRIVMRVLCSHDGGIVPSIASVFAGAEWHERELCDFFGVTFEGNPNSAPLLLTPDERLVPLRKASQARRLVRELMEHGDIVYQSSDFDLFDPQGPAGTPVDKAEGTEGEEA